MGAELGATTSVFPSDENTKDFLVFQGRGEAYRPLAADEDAVYDEVLEVDLSTLAPLAAMPHSPDNVRAVSEIAGIKVDQVAIGSCTNSSYTDLMKVAGILKGRRVHPEVSLVISPGSAAILSKLARGGALADLIEAGARVIENACGPCIGMGQSPKSGAVSLRTFNRNFKGRSGTLDADVYLVSPETAALSAVTGTLTDGLAEGRSLGVELPTVAPETFTPIDNFFIRPGDADSAGGAGNAGAGDADHKAITTDTPVVMGPNIKPFPRNTAMEERIRGKVVLRAGDNITTDDIMPSDSRLLPYRSNIPYLANYCFEKIDAGFSARAKQAGRGVIIGGENYGQGSSREHAALVPLYLGIKFVIAKSFARIHRSNLINSGILTLVFTNHADYEKIRIGDDLVIEDARAQLASDEIIVRSADTGTAYRTVGNFSDLEKQMLLAGGKINLIKGT
jgi:aconitate hydratase